MITNTTKPIPQKLVTDLLDVNGYERLTDIMSITIDAHGMTVVECLRDEEGKRYVVDKQIATRTTMYEIKWDL